MKLFIRDILLFCLIAIIAIWASGELVHGIVTFTGENILNNADHKVTEAKIRAHKHHKTKHLVLGESVGDQMYGKCVDSIVYSLTSTGALLDVGNYLLLCNYLDSNKDQLPEDVILIFGPLIWKNTFISGLGYSAFIKNFYNTEYMPYMDAELIEHVKKFPFVSLCGIKAYQYSPYIPDFKISLKEEKGAISSLQYNYLKKMQKKCENVGVKFKVLSCPIRRGFKNKVDSIKNEESLFDDDVFEGYFDSVTYMDDSCFVDDNHLKSSYIPRDLYNLYH